MAHRTLLSQHSVFRLESTRQSPTGVSSKYNEGKSGWVVQQTKGKWRSLGIVAMVVVGLISWRYTASRIQQATFDRLNGSLYHAMVFTQRYGQRTYQPHRGYYYANLYDPQNFAMVRATLMTYLQHKDPSAVLKTLVFRTPNSQNLIGLATVAISILPGMVTHVTLNDTIPVSHFLHASARLRMGQTRR